MLTTTHWCAADTRLTCVQAQRGTALGKLAKRYLHASALVPDAVYNELVSARLAQMDVLQFGYVLDGYPHTRAQVEFLTSRGLVPDKVLLLPPRPTSPASRLSPALFAVVARYQCVAGLGSRARSDSTIASFSGLFVISELPRSFSVKTQIWCVNKEHARFTCHTLLDLDHSDNTGPISPRVAGRVAVSVV